MTSGFYCVQNNIFKKYNVYNRSDKSARIIYDLKNDDIIYIEQNLENNFIMINFVKDNNQYIDHGYIYYNKSNTKNLIYLFLQPKILHIHLSRSLVNKLLICKGEIDFIKTITNESNLIKKQLNDNLKKTNRLLEYYKNQFENMNYRYNILNELGDYRYVKIHYDYQLIKKQKEKMHNQLLRNFNLYKC